MDVQQGGRSLDRFEHRHTVVFGQMQIQNDDARARVQVFPLRGDESEGFRAIPENFELIGFIVVIQSVAQKKNIGATIFDYENSRGQLAGVWHS